MGLGCPDIHYDVGDYVRNGTQAAVDQIHQISALLGGQELEINTKFNANNHIMGGAIMGKDPKDSVTNGECRAHDHANLWLPGGATMPSASVVNTTLSMAALGLRAADSIKRFFA